MDLRTGYNTPAYTVREEIKIEKMRIEAEIQVKSTKKNQRKKVKSK